MKKLLPLNTIADSGIRLYNSGRALTRLYNCIISDDVEEITRGELVNESFSWSSTPQGSDFWREISDNPRRKYALLKETFLEMFTREGYDEDETRFEVEQDE